MVTKLNHTALVVLGMVAAGDRSGWAVVQTVERSTRYFWPASRGGIYPELRKLQSAGLLHLEDDSKGDVTRHSYTLTDEGQRSLDSWLLDDTDDGIFEMRNEDLLRLFFAEELGRAQQIDLLRRMGAMHERRGAVLEQQIRPSAETKSNTTRLLTLDYGIALHQAAAQWCRAAEERLSEK